jgi:hypothetical protein
MLFKLRLDVNIVSENKILPNFNSNRLLLIIFHLGPELIEDWIKHKLSCVACIR